MEKTIEKLDAAYQLLSLLSVNGNNVDILAAARSKLRGVKEELEKLEAQKEEGGVESNELDG